MTVKKLIEALKKMPQDAEVTFPNMEIDQLEPIGTVELKNDWGRAKVVLS